MTIQWEKVGNMDLVGKTFMGSAFGSPVSMAKSLFGEGYDLEMPSDHIPFTFTIRDLRLLKRVIDESSERNYSKEEVKYLYTLFNKIKSITDSNSPEKGLKL